MKALKITQLPTPSIHPPFLLDLLRVIACCHDSSLASLRPLTRVFSNRACSLRRVIPLLLGAHCNTNIAHIHVLTITWSNSQHSALSTIEIGLVESSCLLLKASWGQDRERSWNPLLIQHISLEMLLIRKNRLMASLCRHKFSRKINAWTCSQSIGKA